MALTQGFCTAMQNRDIHSMQITMKNSFYSDPSGADFEEMERAAAQHGINLYETHDGGVFETDSSKWDKAYVNNIMVELSDNFSRERVEHLKKVVRHMHPEVNQKHKQTYSQKGTPTSQTMQENYRNRNRNYQEQKDYDIQHGNVTRIEPAIGAATGAAVGAGIGCAVGGPVGAAIGGAVGGAAGYIAGNNINTK